MKAITLLFTLSFSVIVTFSAGFRLPNQSAEITARGNAGFASVSDVSAVYYNPAALAHSDISGVQLGLNTIHFGAEVDLSSGTSWKSDNDLAIVPTFFYSGFYKDFHIGIGVFSPFGLSNRFDSSVPFSFLSYESSVDYVRVPLVISKKIHDSLSISAGIHVNYICFKSAFRESNFSLSKLEGDGVDFGSVWALLYEPFANHKIGLIYNSKVKHSVEGNNQNSIAGSIPFSTNMILPEYLDIGYSYQPNQRWLFEVGVEWVNWETLNTVTLVYKDTLSDKTIPYHWESALIYHLGIAHFYENHTFSIGYNYTENSIPDEFFNPTTADAIRNGLSGGWSFKKNNLDFQLSYQYSFSERQVTGRISQLADGYWETSYRAFILSVDYQF